MFCPCILRCLPSGGQFWIENTRTSWISTPRCNPYPVPFASHPWLCLACWRGLMHNWVDTSSPIAMLRLTPPYQQLPLDLPLAWRYIHENHSLPQKRGPHRLWKFQLPRNPKSGLEEGVLFMAHMHLVLWISSSRRKKHKQRKARRGRDPCCWDIKVVPLTLVGKGMTSILLK